MGGGGVAAGAGGGGVAGEQWGPGAWGRGAGANVAVLPFVCYDVLPTGRESVGGKA